MGNDIGKVAANRMAIAAMSNVTSIEKKEMLQLQKAFLELSQRTGNPELVSKDEFQEGLERVGLTDSDKEILDRLFIMLDKTGDYSINYKEFLCGIAPLITGTLKEKVQFSFELYDVDGTSRIKPTEMTFALKAMNSASSYFGDPVMTQEQVEQLVDEVFKEADPDSAGELAFDEITNLAAEHHLMTSFASGRGSVRYGSSR